MKCSFCCLNWKCRNQLVNSCILNQFSSGSWWKYWARVGSSPPPCYKGCKPPPPSFLFSDLHQENSWARVHTYIRDQSLNLTPAMLSNVLRLWSVLYTLLLNTFSLKCKTRPLHHPIHWFECRTRAVYLEYWFSLELTNYVWVYLLSQRVGFE